MKPLEGTHKDDDPTTESVTSQEVDPGSSNEDTEKSNPNNPDKLLKVTNNSNNSPINDLIVPNDQSVTLETANGPISTSNDVNKDGKEESSKLQNLNDPETRGRKMTSVNFLPCDCKLCGEKFTSDKALGYHIRDVHVVGKKDKKEGEGNRKKKPKDYHYVRGKDWKVLNPKRPYCCSICSKRFLYESSLNHHKVVKHNEKIEGGGDGIEGGNGDPNDGNATNSVIPPKMYNHTFQCDQCGKLLMSKHSLLRHLVSFHGTDHEKPFQCDICGQRYVSISSLVSHRRKEHTGDKPYVCEHCGKAFTMSNRLKCHLRVHSDEKFYKCQQCSKQFKSCSAFRAHKDTHLGVMRHTCKYCERKFLFQGNMIKHIRRRHPNGGDIVTSGSNEGESGPVGMSNNIENGPVTTNNLVFTPEGDNQHQNLSTPIGTSSTTGNIVSNFSVGGNNVFHSSIGNTTTTMTVNSVPVTSTNHNVITPSRRYNNNTHRYLKTIQTPDHSYFTKEAAINVHSHPHLDVIEHQNMQSLSPLEQFAQPEIQFQVLPLSSLPNQELFNGINNYQSTSINQTNSGSTSTPGTVGNGLNQGQTVISNQSRDSRLDFSSPTSSPGPVKCRLCDQEFSDIRFHINDFHRIPMQKIESMMPTMIYF